MMRTLLLPVLVLASAASLHDHALAEQAFSCAGAAVRIDVRALQRGPRQQSTEAVITVSRDGLDTILRYTEIDFIGGQCLARGEAPPLLVFQAYCGGSGCKDLDNWGVVDPVTLRVLLVPADGNRAAARQIAGGTALPQLSMLNVSAPAGAGK